MTMHDLIFLYSDVSFSPLPTWGNWYAAKDFCERSGSKMAHIKTKSDIEKLCKALPKNSNTQLIAGI